MGELDESTGTAEQEARICPEAVCGTNSDVIARNGIWEASLNGVADINGVSLVTRAGTSRPMIWGANDRAYYLKVMNGKISGTPVVGTGRISGQSLVGAAFQFKKNGTVIYTVSIDAVRSIPLPVGDPGSVEAYTMSWSSSSGVPVPACPAGAGLGINETLVFEGDRIDAARLTMSSDAQWDPSWFNLACGESALAKLRMLRKTQGNGTADWGSRQATLKMLTADYCGTGDNFTRVGTPIAWKDDGLVSDYTLTGVTPSHIEARWNQYGATCLNTPRLEASGQQWYVSQYIYNTCLPLPCYDTNLTNPPNVELNGSRIVSANP